jgi:hypothetical protein
MTEYLFSFPASAMDVPDADMAAVGEASHAVIRQARDAGVYVVRWWHQRGRRAPDGRP